MRKPMLAAIFGELKHISAKQFFCIKKAPQRWEARSDGVWVKFIEMSIRLVLNFDGQFRRLNIDGFNGLTDNATNGVEHLRSGLQLSLF